MNLLYRRTVAFLTLWAYTYSSQASIDDKDQALITLSTKEGLDALAAAVSKANGNLRSRVKTPTTANVNIEIAVRNSPKQQMSYGMDYKRLWYWYGPQTNLNQVAQWSVADTDINFIRVGIHPGYELEEGVFDESVYKTEIIPMMKAMQDAKPDIKFFASPIPVEEAIKDEPVPWTPYPLWINIYGNSDRSSFIELKTDKCAGYLVRYIQLMASYGFKIDYLDLTNEWNEMTATDMAEIKALMVGELDDQMPKILAPSAWSYTEGATWLKEAALQGETDAYDIAAVHNTGEELGEEGVPEDFANEAIKQGKEVWNSELHGWEGETPATEIPTSIELFNTINSGFSAMSGWLAIGTTRQGHCYFLNDGETIERNVKYYIYSKLANTSNNGHALDCTSPDELTSTMALIRDNLLTVWVLNNEDSDKPITINVDDFEIAAVSTIQSTRWNSNIALMGETETFTASSSTGLALTVQANSLYCFEILLESTRYVG